MTPDLALAGFAKVANASDLQGPSHLPIVVGLVMSATQTSAW